MLVALALLAIPLLPLLEALRSGAGLKSIFKPDLLLLGLPFVIVFLIVSYRHYSWRYTVGEGNIESRRGIIAREVNLIRITDVRNINVRQTLFERILFIGDVEFGSSGTADVEVVFQGVSRPMRVKRKVQEMLP